MHSASSYVWIIYRARPGASYPSSGGAGKGGGEPRAGAGSRGVRAVLLPADVLCNEPGKKEVDQPARSKPPRRETAGEPRPEGTWTYLERRGSGQAGVTQVVLTGSAGLTREPPHCTYGGTTGARPGRLCCCFGFGGECLEIHFFQRPRMTDTGTGTTVMRNALDTRRKSRERAMWVQTCIRTFSITDIFTGWYLLLTRVFGDGHWRVSG